MKNLHNLSELHIHFIGIGGISMSGLAKLMLNKGARVTGSDNGDNPEINKLKALGVKVFSSHCIDNITNDIDLVIYTGAIKLDNTELRRARSLGIVTMERSEFLGLVTKEYSKVIAVAGTHGKTTTTAMLGVIMERAGLNPTIHIGGESINLKDNTVIGGNEYFLLEACEYRESFRYLNPYIAVVTNIELDHLDYYSDYNSIHDAFSRFASNSKHLISLDTAHLNHKDNHLIEKDWQAKNIEYIYDGYNFNVYYKNEYFETFRLNVIGLHNVTNALFAIATAYQLGIDKECMVEGIADYMGVERRYERIARINNNCNVIIDYAHHPTEIKASINGISAVYKNILYVFQPHTYSRTKKLFNDFIEVLQTMDHLVIFQTYPAREEIIVGGRAIDLFKALKVNNKEYFENIEKLIEFIYNKQMNYDCVLVLGAGDLADKLKKFFYKNNKEG